jgi:predicted glycosyltransferase involved in capsule biosynthesis
MNMFDLNDVSFLIPYRYDSEARLRNLKLVTKYLKKNFSCHIMCTENAKTRTFFDSGIDHYTFQENQLETFHRTKILNEMCRATSRSIICLYDTDVFLTPNQYINATQAIRTNHVDMVYPYDGRFYNIENEEYLNKFQACLSTDFIQLDKCHLIHPASVGGCIFFSRKRFMELGMENENFKSWGWEDNSRLVTHKKLGSRIARLPGVLYHLHHPSSANSANTTSEAYKNNEREFYKVSQMTVEQLKQYISTWDWK